MGKNYYTAVLRYDPQDAQIHQKVIACLARLDPNAVGRFEKTAFTGRLILKRHTDPATARRLKQLFSTTGAVCDIYKTPEKPIDATADGPKVQGLSPAAGQEAHPPLMRCPKCGCEQPAHPECRACGIIVAKAIQQPPSAVVERPAATPAPVPQSHRMLERMRRWTRPVRMAIQKIQHPIDVRKLTTWSKKVADRLIRCGIVLAIATVLEIGLLAMGKMLWSLYAATAMGQYYIERLQEKAQVFQRITEADPVALGLDTTLMVFCVILLVACAAQILHLIRYLYDSQGIIGQLILWYIPCAGLTAWIISQRPPYPTLALAGTLTFVPTLCMLSSCLYLARIILPEVGDLSTAVSIIMKNRESAWSLIIKKIRIWFDTTKRVC